ncbi:MAG: signal recognition particle-docking protein FtsY [Oscillospiraceae bacterium]|jgi:fused signal recognition particle receptor|nr:signal recognition particle-docking protein FtsY [Oscillospiraceae bacterium]
MGFFGKLTGSLRKTRETFVKGVDSVFRVDQVNEELFERLEETLILSDVGMHGAAEICKRLRGAAKKLRVSSSAELKKEFVNVICEMLAPESKEGESSGAGQEVAVKIAPKKVILVVGVNGVGKTTTVGKLAFFLKNQGERVSVAAADTFRDAAAAQLAIWVERAGVRFVKNQATGDPGAVVFDAIKDAKEQEIDVLICDTAGRLHNKKNLMAELHKIGSIIERNCPNAVKEVFLVLDATTGQTAISQAREFKSVVDVTGIVLTKLDGTSKGGVVLGVRSELDVPIRFVGLGENLEDLLVFDPREFAAALFG